MAEVRQMVDLQEDEEILELSDEEYLDLCELCKDSLKEKDKELFSRIQELAEKNPTRRIGPETFIRDYRLCMPTPFILLAQSGRTAAVKFFLTDEVFRGTTDMNQKGTVVSKATSKHVHGATALWVAATGGHIDLVQLLLQHGATVDLATGSNSTPLRGASFHGFLKVMDILLDNGANVNTPNSVGQSPFLIAVLRNQEQAVRLLLKRGANKYQQTVNGYTALHLAAAKGRIEMLKLLIDEEGMIPDYNKPDSSKQDYVPSPIFLAASTKMVPVVRYLMEHTSCPPMVAVDALFLVGSTIFECSDRSYAVEQVQRFWLEAWDMKAKAEAEGHREWSPASSWTLIPGIQEFRTRDDIRYAPSGLSMHVWYALQSLIIRERIMGPGDPGLIFFLVHRGYKFCKPMIGCPEPRFRLAERLFAEALKLTKYLNEKGQQHGRDFVDTLKHDLEKDLCNIQAGLGRIVNEWTKYPDAQGSQPPDFAFFVSFALEQLDFLREQMPGSNLISMLASILMIFYHWIRFVTEVEGRQLHFGELDLTTGVDAPLHCLGQRLVASHLRAPLDTTLLHLAVDALTEHIKHYHLPSYYNPELLVTALLHWGAYRELNAVDARGLRPIHVAIKLACTLWSENPKGAMGVLQPLLDNGCEAIAVSPSGWTVQDFTEEGFPPFFEVFQRHLVSLSALSANAVATQVKNYDCMGLPSHVLEQIRLYDCRCAQQEQLKCKQEMKRRMLMDNPT